MTTAAVSAFGTVLARNGTTVAELTNIGSPKLKLDTIDVTTHQSSDKYREYVGSLIDGGELSLEGNFKADDTDGQIGLITDLNARTLQTWTITFPASTGTVWSFSALVTAFEIDDAPVDGKFGFKATLKVSGKPTLTVATSAGLTTTFLAFSAGTLVPAAAQAVTEYVLSEANDVTGITITPTASAGVITITANGVSQVVTSGQASTTIALGTAGSITEVKISVKETNKAAKVYTIYVAKAS